MTDRKPGMLSILADLQKPASEASKEGDVGNRAGDSAKQASAPRLSANQTANESLGQGTRTAGVADAVQAGRCNSCPWFITKQTKKGGGDQTGVYPNFSRESRSTGKP